MNKKAWIGVVIVVAALAVALLIMQPWVPSSKSINFGATFPLTGEVASYGQKAKRGIEMAVSEQNAKGGLLGKQIAVDFQDDRNDKKEAVSIMTKFATIDKMRAVFGSAGSGVSLAIAPLANRYKVILISPISSSSQLSTEGGAFFFRTCPADTLQAEVLSKWVFDSGVKRVAVVYTNNSWGKPLAEGFQKKFESLGGQVINTEGVQESTADFRTIIAKLKGMEKLDAVVSPTYPKEGGIFVRQAKELGLSVPLYGGDNWGSPEFRNVAGDASEGVFYTAPSENASSTFKKFAEQYKEKYGEAPDVFGAYAYDAAMAIFRAVETTGATDPTKVRDALLKESFQGVSGEVAFRSNGDLQSEAFAKKTIKNGQAVNIK
jgi:branched-chain amino acid transport system substrate-binding protein